MDDVSLDFRGALVRVFAEFALLPDLLRLFGEGLNTVGDWAGMLDEFGYNEDHVEDEDIPDGMSLTEFMAADAMQFCRWIALIGPRGGGGGGNAAGAQAVPYRRRTPSGAGSQCQSDIDAHPCGTDTTSISRRKRRSPDGPSSKRQHRARFAWSLLA